MNYLTKTFYIALDKRHKCSTFLEISNDSLCISPKTTKNISPQSSPLLSLDAMLCTCLFTRRAVSIRRFVFLSTLPLSRSDVEQSGFRGSRPQESNARASERELVQPRGDEILRRAWCVSLCLSRLRNKNIPCLRAKLIRILLRRLADAGGINFRAERGKSMGAVRGWISLEMRHVY